MPLDIIQLDTMYPATWTGRDPAPVPDFTDPQTSVRFMLGHDKLNYFNFQRWSGDLFKRDLMLDGLLQAINNYLGTRTGLAFNLPLTRIQAGHFAHVGQITLTSAQNPSVFLIAVDCRVLSGDATHGVLEVMDETGGSDIPPIYVTVAANRPSENYFVAVHTTDRHRLPVATHTYSFRLRNTTGVGEPVPDIPTPVTTIDACACVVWQASERPMPP